VRQAEEAGSFTASVGDARRLDQDGESQDAVVLFGPLYHLTSADDRRLALDEAHRVLRPGGRLMAMAISRCASMLDGLYRDWLDDPVFRAIVDRDLAEGQHRNPDPAGRRHEQILFAARAIETDPSVIGFTHHFIAAATRD
jgi:ubiquinone/menaquinone biosynthesis C-methylase UbiE